MSSRNTYTLEERQRAIDLYVQHGRKHASEVTGISPKTITTWASRAGVVEQASENRQRSITAARDSFDVRREDMKLSLLEELEAALTDMRKPYDKVVKMGDAEMVVNVAPTPRDRKDLAMTVGVLFDKLQLATGGATAANQEVIDVDLRALLDQQDAENDRIYAELKAQVDAESAEYEARSAG